MPVIRFLTAHPTKNSSAISKTISWGEHVSGQWKKPAEICEKIRESLATAGVIFRPPSHAIAMIGENDFIESDWGDPFFDNFLFKTFPISLIRKNSGVRRITRADLDARSAEHLVWEIECSIRQKIEFERLAIEVASWRVGYDFKGLYGAALKVANDLFEKHGGGIHFESLEKIHDKKKFFCSEFVAFLLFSVGIQILFPPHEISPALLPSAVPAARPAEILKKLKSSSQ